MKEQDDFIVSLKKKKRELSRKFKIIYETEPKLRDSLARKIELLNILIHDFGLKRSMRKASLNNLKHRSKF